MIATKYVDRLEEAAKVIGSINTIIVEKDAEGKTILVGENYDWAGVHNSLVLSLPETDQAKEKPFGEGKNGFIIGGGSSGPVCDPPPSPAGRHSRERARGGGGTPKLGQSG